MPRGRGAHFIRMLAVIETGGKQYLIVPGQTIKVEKINKKDKSEVVFDKVLLVEKNKKLEVGDPFVKGTTVIGELISQGKHEKKIFEDTGVKVLNHIFEFFGTCKSCNN